MRDKKTLSAKYADSVSTIDIYSRIAVTPASMASLAFRAAASSSAATSWGIAITPNSMTLSRSAWAAADRDSSAAGAAGRWYYFQKFKCWAQYAYRIDGPILFHSVLYSEKDESTLRKGSVYALGSRASHGCIRLKVEDAKWIYNNCPAGTTVVVY